MDVTPSGMAIEVKLIAFLNVLLPMVVNWELEQKVTDVKPEQLLNTFVAMFVTPSGMAIEVKLLAFLNACKSMIFN